jgi:uncharacterized sulfatase
MKAILITLAALLSICHPPCAGAVPPNIILIITDDHGWADIGAQGADAHLRTPNIDQLARDGVRFTRGYVTAPQCTPSRAGLMSGIYQNKLGVEQNFDVLRGEVVTLQERLKKSGYTTGISGKWHLDVALGKDEKHVYDPDLAPQSQGFDEYFNGGMQAYSASHALNGKPYQDAPRNVTAKGCRVALKTEWALQFLKRRAAGAGKTKPFFLYLAYMAPHVPLEFPQSWISKIPKDLPRERRSALALLAAIDEGVGKVRQQLRDMGQENNTLIFLLGDNGAPLGDKWDGSINQPMRGQKGMLSEGGIRVPFLAAWPGKIPGGRIFDHPVIGLDIAATATASAGQPPAPELDGVNLLPHLTGLKKEPPHQTLCWRWVDQAAIQEFPYKLMLLGGNKTLLFDITKPEGEDHAHELSARQPETAKQLRTKLDTWLGTLKPPGPPKPWVREGAYIQAGILPGNDPPGTKQNP